MILCHGFVKALFCMFGLGHNLTLENFHYILFIVYLPQVTQNLIFNATNFVYVLLDELPN